MHQNAPFFRINLLEAMKKDFEKFFKEGKLLEPPSDLFDHIIMAIKRERELQRAKRLLFGFLFLFIISIGIMPLSLKMLMNQMRNSGILYFISTAISDFETFVIFWQDFIFAIIESLPIVEITFFIANLLIFLFTIRFFLIRKRLLLAYLI